MEHKADMVLLLVARLSFGSRCSVSPKVKIGDQAYIGAGPVVLRDVGPGCKVAGVPARRIG